MAIFITRKIFGANDMRKIQYALAIADRYLKVGPTNTRKLSDALILTDRKEAVKVSDLTGYKIVPVFINKKGETARAGSELSLFQCNGHAYCYDNEDYILYNVNGDNVAHYEPPTCNDEYCYYIETESGEVMHSEHENEVFAHSIRDMLAGQYEAFNL